MKGLMDSRWSLRWKGRGPKKKGWGLGVVVGDLGKVTDSAKKTQFIRTKFTHAFADKLDD